ncbi:MAG: hypothetical protein IJR29_09005 [Butyrivibrio sp.]|nr:hypothetical protein [Butyrivibrio sp.]
MSQKKMIIEPGGGLGNRLLFISSAYNLAKDCGITDIKLMWRNNNECGCNFEDVISALPLPSEVVDMHFGKDSYAALIKSGRIIEALRKFFQGIGYKVFRVYTKKYQLPIYQDMPQNEKNVLKEYVEKNSEKIIYIEGYYSFYGDVNLSDVRFEEDIFEKVKEFKRNFGSYDAMHIRRTDNAVAIENSPTELFYDKVAEIVAADSNKKIYIATDDNSILENLKSKYPANIISSTREVSRISSEGMKFALYEMLILSRADVLYASFGSTFTIIANAIGNNQMVVLKKEPGSYE